jgi:hypothetical protein
MIDALFILYVTTELGLGPALLGIVLAGGGPGALLGALASSRIAQRFGVGPTIVWMQVLTGISRLLIPLAVGSRPLVVVLLVRFANDNAARRCRRTDRIPVGIFLACAKGTRTADSLRVFLTCMV